MIKKSAKTIKKNSYSDYCNTRGYYCYLSIKSRCVEFKLYLSICVYPPIRDAHYLIVRGGGRLKFRSNIQILDDPPPPPNKI